MNNRPTFQVVAIQWSPGDKIIKIAEGEYNDVPVSNVSMCQCINVCPTYRGRTIPIMAPTLTDFNRTHIVNINETLPNCPPNIRVCSDSANGKYSITVTHQCSNNGKIKCLLFLHFSSCSDTYTMLAVNDKQYGQV